MQIRLCEEYQKNRSDEPGVHFDNIAVLCLGDYLSSVSVFALSEEEAWAQAVSLGTELLENNAQLQPEDSIQRAWDFTVDWIGSNREHFRGHIPEKILLDLIADVLGISPMLDDQEALEHINHIEMHPNNRVLFVFQDGHTEEHFWKDHSRRDSCDAEKRKKAAEKTKEQRKRRKEQTAQ